MTATTFTINGKLYEAKEIGFDEMCDFEEMGVSMEQVDKKPMSTIRAYFAICAKIGTEEAGKEIEKHVINGGKLDDLSNAFGKMASESGFFLALSGQTNKKESPKRTLKKEKEEEKAE